MVSSPLSKLCLSERKTKGEQKRKVRDEEHRVLAFNVRSLSFFFFFFSLLKAIKRRIESPTPFAVSPLYRTRLIKRKKAREEVSELNI